MPFHHVRIGKVANMGGVPTISWANDYPDPETNSSHLKLTIPKGNDRIPTLHFQVFLLLVSGRVFLNVLWSLQLNQESRISRSNPPMEIWPDVLQSLPKRKADSRTKVESFELNTLSSTLPRFIWNTTGDSITLTSSLFWICHMSRTPHKTRFGTVPVPVVWRVSVSFAPQKWKPTGSVELRSHETWHPPGHPKKLPLQKIPSFYIHFSHKLFFA